MYKCRICGKEHEKALWMAPHQDLCSADCFNRNFWLEIIDEAKKDKYLHPVMDGTCYCICDENSKSSFRGFGGALFYITFNDGHMVATTNLWSNGSVDSRFKDQLPDNAHRSTLEEIKKNPRIRALWAAHKLLSTPWSNKEKCFMHPTIRDIAEELGISKSAIGVDLKERVPKFWPLLAVQVQGVLSTAYNEKHIRGGKATARRYKDEQS